MPDRLLLDRLLLIADLFQRDMARTFAGTELSGARMAVLWVVHHSGPVTQQTLAAALDVTPRNISALVDAMEAAGYVHRAPHPSDRRAHLVELTDAGAELMAETTREHAELSGRLLDAVDPEDRHALERGLDAIATRLAQLIADAHGEIPDDTAS